MRRTLVRESRCDLISADEAVVGGDRRSEVSS